MAFLAIVHAPVLRAGARLCIADLAQTPDLMPRPVGAGAEVDLRFGTCCPDLAHGAISVCEAQTDVAILSVAGADWTIKRSRGGGVTVPGLLSEDWLVVEA